MNMTNIRAIFSKNKRPLSLALLACIVIYPFLVSDFLIRVVTTVFLYCILTLGNMVISGHTGMLNMGHAAFYGVGAYISAVLSVNYGVPFIVCFLLAGLGAGICGLLVSIPCLRLSTDFLSLITIAFSNVFLTIVRNWMDVTRGPMGIPAIPPATLFGFAFDTPVSSYFLIFAVALLTYLLLNNLIKTKLGRAMQATRDDEIGAQSVGVKTNRYKILAFAVGTAFAGLAGSLMVHYIGFVGPNNFTFDESLLIMQMCILGGLGSQPGAVVGAAFLTIIPEVIRPLATYRIGLGGLIMILCMLFRPQGILGSRAFAGDSGIQDRIKHRLQKMRLSRGKTAGKQA